MRTSPPGSTHVAVTGSLRLAPAFAVGAALRMVTATDVAVMQRGHALASDAPYTTPITLTSTECSIGHGEDVAMPGIEVTRESVV